MKDFIAKMFSFKGEPSSKRVVGVLAGLGIITYSFIYPSESSNNSMLILALTGLGFTTIEKIFKPR